MKKLIIILTLLFSVNSNAAQIDKDTIALLTYMDMAADASINCYTGLSLLGYDNLNIGKSELSQQCVVFGKTMKRMITLADKYDHKTLRRSEIKHMTKSQKSTYKQKMVDIKKLMQYMKLNKLNLDSLIDLE